MSDERKVFLTAEQLADTYAESPDFQANRVNAIAVSTSLQAIKVVMTFEPSTSGSLDVFFKRVPPQNALDRIKGELSNINLRRKVLKITMPIFVIVRNHKDKVIMVDNLDALIKRVDLLYQVYDTFRPRLLRGEIASDTTLDESIDPKVIEEWKAFSGDQNG